MTRIKVPEEIALEVEGTDRGGVLDGTEIVKGDLVAVLPEREYDGVALGERDAHDRGGRLRCPPRPPCELDGEGDLGHGDGGDARDTWKSPRPGDLDGREKRRLETAKAAKLRKRGPLEPLRGSCSGAAELTKADVRPPELVIANNLLR